MATAGEVVAFADATALSRITANLLQNAWKHGRPPRNGTSSSRIRLVARLEGSDPVLEVRDNGPGVPANERSLIFERFHRGRDAARKSGAGIGLALSRELAREMGGELTVTDTGEETVFRLTLPPVPLPEDHDS